MEQIKTVSIRVLSFSTSSSICFTSRSRAMALYLFPFIFIYTLFNQFGCSTVLNYFCLPVSLPACLPACLKGQSHILICALLSRAQGVQVHLSPGCRSLAKTWRLHAGWLWWGEAAAGQPSPRPTGTRRPGRCPGRCPPHRPPAGSLCKEVGREVRLLSSRSSSLHRIRPLPPEGPKISESCWMKGGIEAEI